MISAVSKQYVYRLFIVALIGIKFCMYANTNVTIPGAKFPKHWFKNRYKITKKRFAYNSWTQCSSYHIKVILSAIRISMCISVTYSGENYFCACKLNYMLDYGGN